LTPSLNYSPVSGSKGTIAFLVGTPSLNYSPVSGSKGTIAFLVGTPSLNYSMEVTQRERM